MLAVLSLEFIGEHFDAYARAATRIAKKAGYDLGHKSNRPWVARITGRCETYTYARSFLHGQIDYSRANSTGSRGVYLYFALKNGIYEVHAHLSWKRSRRYFIRVEEAKITEISTEEVEAWLDKETDAAD
jgi:hypothetical protein